MTNIAHHINSMKRRHEHAVRVQEIQSLLYGWEVRAFGIDLKPKNPKLIIILPWRRVLKFYAIKMDSNVLHLLFGWLSPFVC